jgi:Shikimate kinase
MASRHRIQLIGCSGAGKSTLGHALAQRLQVPFVDLDDLYWEPGWVGVGNAELARRLEPILARERWVIAGNYTATTEHHVWPRLTELVILDLPLRQLLLRSARRTAQRILTGETCCNGYTLRVWKTRHARFATLAASDALAHARVTHLRSDAEVEAWVERWPSR